MQRFARQLRSLLMLPSWILLTLPQPRTGVGGTACQSSSESRELTLTSFALLRPGGEFTRQADVTFLPRNEKLSIRQEFKGIDEHDHLVMSTNVEGQVPEVPRGSTVRIEPYSEIYQYSSNRKRGYRQRLSISFHNNSLRSLFRSSLFAPSPLQLSPPPPPGTTRSLCPTAPLRPGRTSGVRPSPSRAASTATPCETWGPRRCSMWTKCLSCMTPTTSSVSPWPIRSETSTVRSPFPVLVCLHFRPLEEQLPDFEWIYESYCPAAFFCLHHTNEWCLK